LIAVKIQKFRSHLTTFIITKEPRSQIWERGSFVIHNQKLKIYYLILRPGDAKEGVPDATDI